MCIDTKKIIRTSIIVICFMALMTLCGMQIREAQQYLYMVACMALFGFLLDNIWVSAFLWLTTFLYIFHKQLYISQLYLQNVFFGCVLYMLTKISFKKEHINLFINVILWLIVCNILYMIVQLFGYDFIYGSPNTNPDLPGKFLRVGDPAGFMGNKAQMGVLMAMGIPFLVSKPGYKYTLLSLLLFIPIYISQSAICLLAGVVGFIFPLWFKPLVYKKAIIAVCIVTMLAGFGYATFNLRASKLPFSCTLRFEAWKGILQDAYIHPITGWGLDSFRNKTPVKDFLYMTNPRATSHGQQMDYLDNPHNLYISLLYEWGLGGLIILIGLLRMYGIAFTKAIKEPELIGLAGLLLTVLITSVAQFPMFLTKLAIIVIVASALYEVQVKG